VRLTIVCDCPCTLPHAHSGRPAMQTVPRPIKIDLHDEAAGAGAEAAAAAAAAAATPGSFQLNIRSAFVAPPGCVMLSVDFRQVCWCEAWAM